MRLVLHHWTHKKNLRSILMYGLLASKAQGGTNLVWACNQFRVAWALCHVARRHSWNADELVCIQFVVEAGDWKPTQIKGVFNTPKDVQPVAFDNVKPHVIYDWITVDEWLTQFG